MNQVDESGISNYSRFRERHVKPIKTEYDHALEHNLPSKLALEEEYQGALMDYLDHLQSNLHLLRSSGASVEEMNQEVQWAETELEKLSTG